MKTKELVKLLNEADPTGEEEVCVGNVSIVDVETLPAYYDGPLQIIQKDRSCKYKRTGKKVVLYISSFSDLLWDRPDTEIDYSELNDFMKSSYKERHDEIRRETKALDVKLDLDYFKAWSKTRASILNDDEENILEVACKFFNEISNEPIPEHIPRFGINYIEMKHRQWDEQLEIIYAEDGFLIRKKCNNGDKNS